MNFADSPEIAVSVGSARMRETPACSNARKVARKENPPVWTDAVMALASGEREPVSGKPVLFVKTLPPSGFRAAQLPLVLMPNCFRTVRATSTTVTRIIT